MDFFEDSNYLTIIHSIKHFLGYVNHILIAHNYKYQSVHFTYINSHIKRK